MTVTNYQFPEFINHAWEKSGFSKPTHVQKESFPVLLERKNAIIESPTGTGKTAAYLIPVLAHMNKQIENAQSIVLAPTRELAMQIYEVFQTFSNGAFSGASLIGGANIQRQIDRLKKKPQFIVGTPGRIRELIQAKKLKMHEVKSIIIDEADSMLELGLKDEVENVIKSTMKDRQLVFVSATINQKTNDWAKELTEDIALLKVKKEESASANVQHLFIESEARDKIENLRKFIKHTPSIRAIVFINSSARMDELAAKLEFRKVDLGVLAGNSTKQERQSVMRQFKQGIIPILLTTDVASRGIDIEEVTHVIHFDLAEDEKQYIHRSGRTGRMGKEGNVVSLVNDREMAILEKWSSKLKFPLVKTIIAAGEIKPKKTGNPTRETKEKNPKDSRNTTTRKNQKNNRRRREMNDR